MHEWEGYVVWNYELFNVALRHVLNTRLYNRGRNTCYRCICRREKKIRFVISLAKHVIQSAYVSSGFHSVVRDILIFPFHQLATFTDLQAENERKTVPTIVFPEPKAFKVRASGSSTPLIFTNPLFQKTETRVTVRLVSHCLFRISNSIIILYNYYYCIIINFGLYIRRSQYTSVYSNVWSTTPSFIMAQMLNFL